MSEKEIEIWGRPLEKMTTTELRELAKGLEVMSGVHAMKKEELIEALRRSQGIEVKADHPRGAAAGSLKGRIQSLKAKREAALEAKDRKLATIWRRKISRLKKKTRRAG